MKTYFHVDMDAFFVSVEELFDPSLRGKAVIVGGRPNERGVVSAASYAARAFGVHSAMPLRTAYRLCPHAIFVDGHPDRYRDYSGRVFEVLRKFTPLLDMASVDEAWLDMTGTERLHGPPIVGAHLLHERMKIETSLNCSIGISCSRMVAKVASDAAKPNGVMWVAPGREAAFLRPLEVRRIPGIGKVMERNLHAYGIRKVGDFSLLSHDFLERRFGQIGLALAGKARGMDAGGWFDSAVGAQEEPKSISHEHTFNEDTADPVRLVATLGRLSEQVARRLREHALFAKTIQLKLRFTDFTTITRARSLDHGTQLDTEILATVRELLDANRPEGAKVRLLGVHASGFTHETGQLSLIDKQHVQQWQKAMTAVDRVRDRFGEQSLGLARAMQGRYRERTHENPAGLPGRDPKTKE